MRAPHVGVDQILIIAEVTAATNEFRGAPRT